MTDFFEDIPIIFQNPHWLWLLLLTPLYLFYRSKYGKPSTLKFPSIGLVSEIARQTKQNWNINPRLLSILGLVGAGLLVIAQARPKLQKDVITEKSAEGIDIVLGLDLSGSMLAHDFKINGKPVDRLTVVKKVVRDFIKERKDDRIGIVAFSGAPYLVSPLTMNHDWVIQNLDRLEIGMIPEKKTAIGSAIGMAVNRLKQQTGKSKIIILLTDGANNTGQISPLQAAEAASSYEIKVYTIGAGETGMVPYPVTFSNGTIRRNLSGDPILRRLESEIDLETLQKVSEITNANSYHAKDTATLNNIYKEIDQLEKTEKKINIKYNYKDVYFLPLLFGLGFLLIEQTLTQTRFRRIP